MFFLSLSHNPYIDDPDVKLMLKFKHGEPQAFEQLMKQYFKPILNFIYRYVHNAAWAEDLTQEVFIRVFKSAANYEPKAKFKTWLFTIAHNIAINASTRNKHTAVSLDQSMESDEGQMQRQVEDTKVLRPDEAMLQAERKAFINDAIESLPENQKTAVLLRRFEGLSYAEIAAVMKTSEKAVKSLLNRAKESLRNSLNTIIQREQ